LKCRICGRRVMKHVNHRFHWVEERMCGLCFWGRIYGYFNSYSGVARDRSIPLIAR